MIFMAELSNNDKAALEKLRAASEARKKIPPAERTLVAQPDKFAFPPGLDDHGKPFPPKSPSDKRVKTSEKS